MAVEYSINRCTRRCFLSDRPLLPGENYYSAVIESGDDLKRIDISEEAWTDPPAGVVGYWKCRMPKEVTTKLKPAPDSVLIETMDYLAQQPDREELAFLLGVLLVRRHVLEEGEVDEEESAEGDDDESLWKLVDPNDRSEHLVPRAWPDPERIAKLQKELVELLYCEA